MSARARRSCRYSKWRGPITGMPCCYVLSYISTRQGTTSVCKVVFFVSPSCHWWTHFSFFIPFSRKGTRSTSHRLNSLQPSPRQSRNPTMHKDMDRMSQRHGCYVTRGLYSSSIKCQQVPAPNSGLMHHGDNHHRDNDHFFFFFFFFFSIDSSCPHELKRIGDIHL
ncbi:hypothetical protein H4582DRAFT_1449625 [Lactarius indigo]|nr:hypothetical protein H4582DRAFT_1449625 [Lactarius indigo]